MNPEEEFYFHMSDIELMERCGRLIAEACNYKVTQSDQGTKVESPSGVSGVSVLTGTAILTCYLKMNKSWQRDPEYRFRTKKEEMKCAL